MLAGGLVVNNDLTSIDKLLVSMEGAHLQFREAKSSFSLKEAGKICCALSNAGGGMLVLGITDKCPRLVVGSNAFAQPERTRKWLMDKLDVFLDIKIIECDGKRILIFDVASRPLGLPVAFEGDAWWYEKNNFIHMTDDVRFKIYDEDPYDFSSEICIGADLNAIDANAVNNFRARWGSHRIKTLSDEQLLSDCGLITNNGVTNATIILFGTRKAVRNYLPHIEVIFEYRTSEVPGPAAHRKVFLDGYFNYHDQIWDLINLRNDKQYFDSSSYENSIDTFNELVVREAILNAVAHRNYTHNAQIYICQYPDRLLITNPGTLVRGLVVANMVNSFSLRNPLISSVFQLCGLVEHAGQGLNLMCELSIQDGKDFPDFARSDNYFVRCILNGLIKDKRIPMMFHKMDESLKQQLSTHDYIKLSRFYNKNEVFETNEEIFNNLVNFGIVKKLGTTPIYQLSDIYKRQNHIITPN